MSPSTTTAETTTDSPTTDDTSLASNATTDETTTATPHGEGKAYTSAYVCPMHCEGSGSDEAGDCPVCGMSYVASEDHTKDGHTH